MYEHQGDADSVARSGFLIPRLSGMLAECLKYKLFCLLFVHSANVCHQIAFATGDLLVSQSFRTYPGFHLTFMVLCRAHGIAWTAKGFYAKL